MKNILIPTDFSSSADDAISYALDLFKCDTAHFYFLHAYADEAYGPFKNGTDAAFEHQKQTIKKNAEIMLDEIVDKLRKEKHIPKHSYSYRTVFDSLVDGVNDFVDEKNIDLIIMGTKGKTANKNITFGSQTVQIFKYVKCPVLAVPHGYAFKQPKNILFPSAYLLPYKRRELKLLDTLAAQFKSKIHSLYISDFDDLSHRQLDNKKFLTESLPHARLSFETTTVTNKAQAIMEYIVKNDMDFLVMVNSRHSFIEDMLYRSTVDEIGLTPLIPFLVMQNLPR